MLSRARIGTLARILGSWALFACLIACGFSPEELTPSTDPVVVEPAVPSPTPVAEPAPAAAGGACSRMGACCRAYVAAMGNIPATTCDAYNNIQGMPDALCSQTMAGYRAGLSAMSRDIPADCAE